MPASRRISPSMVVALIALGVALSGTGYAVTTLSRNSVGTKQLKRNAVTSVKVKNGSLKKADFAPGTLLQGVQGLPGAAGPAGTNGAAGAAGAPAFVKTTTVTGISGQEDDATVSLTTWEQIKVLGTFAKSQAATGILLHADFMGATLSDGTCQYQVRIDGKTVTGSASTDPAVAGSGGTAALRDDISDANNLSIPMAISADFGTLAAGDHEVTLWIRGNTASGCSADPINMNQDRALVEEYSK